MPRPISSIPNLGPASERAFARAGITSADELRALGPDAAYAKLLDAGEKPHFIGYYALVMGLMGRPWTDCRGAEKRALRTRFDTLVSASVGRDPRQSAIERHLDAVGLPAPATPRGAGD